MAERLEGDGSPRQEDVLEDKYAVTDGGDVAEQHVQFRTPDGQLLEDAVAGE